MGTKIPATDPDSANDDGATITGNIVESLTFEISGTGSELFTIDNDGQIRTRTKLDHESKESYTFQVRVTDKGTLSDEKQITINILDVNDPPEITNQPVGTDVDGRWKLDHPENLQAIYTYEADDPEGTATTWSLEGADASLFGIEGGALAFKTEPNFEAPADQDTDNQYLVDIKLSDGANTVMEKTTVRVTDVNESPAFGTDWYDESIDENTPGGSELGITLTATDPDSANDDPGVNIPGNIVEIVTYSIGGDDQATFSIESMTGELSLAGNIVINYETKNSYSLTIIATDKAGDTDTATVAISVNDLNEKPSITNTGPTAVQHDENDSTVVADWDTTDPDPADTISWSLDGDDAPDFNISNSGQLSFKNTPDFREPAGPRQGQPIPDSRHGRRPHQRKRPADRLPERDHNGTEHRRARHNNPQHPGTRGEQPDQGHPDRPGRVHRKRGLGLEPGIDSDNRRKPQTPTRPPPRTSTST